MAWWLWIMLGLVLLVLELFVPSGFFMFIVGVACLLTGLLVLVGLGGAVWFQWLLCGALSVVLLLYVRKYLLGGHSFTPSSGDPAPKGEEVLISSDILPGQVGQGELRGTVWSVRNIGAAPLRQGERRLVQSVEGVTLLVL